jgi:hypothetical protein
MAAAKRSSTGSKKPAGTGRKPATRRGSTPKVGQTQTIKSPGPKPISFKIGGLHASLSVPQGQKIPAQKMQAALNGHYGPKAASQARFAKNVLTGPTSGSGSQRKKRGSSRGSKSS